MWLVLSTIIAEIWTANPIERREIVLAKYFKGMVNIFSHFLKTHAFFLQLSTDQARPPLCNAGREVLQRPKHYVYALLQTWFASPVSFQVRRGHWSSLEIVRPRAQRGLSSYHKRHSALIFSPIQWKIPPPCERAYIRSTLSREGYALNGVSSKAPSILATASKVCSINQSAEP